MKLAGVTQDLLEVATLLNGSWRPGRVTKAFQMTIATRPEC